MKRTATPRIFLVMFLLLFASLACSLGGAPSADATAVVPPTDTPIPPQPCNNVFYPFVQGTQWVYHLVNDSGETRLRLNVSQVAGNQATVDVLDMSTGVISQATADCQDGAILNFPLMSLGVLFSNFLVGELNVDYVSGALMPAEADFVAAGWNHTWSGEYIASGVLQVAAEGETTTITMNDSPVRIDWQSAGQETVSVPAGTYENAFKFTVHTRVDVSLDLQGFNVEGQLTIDSFQWYAPDVGLIRNQVQTASLGYAGFTVPVLVNNWGELIEFRPGP